MTGASRTIASVTPQVSVLMPAYNEAPNLSEVVPATVDALDGLGLTHEIVVVDDGSKDDTRSVMSGLQAAHPTVRYVRLRRNLGKSAALSVGFDQVMGDTVVLMDADGQDDPREIHKLLAALDGGLDQVTGSRVNQRRDRFVKRNTSRLYNRATTLVTGVDGRDFNSGFKAMRRPVAETLDMHGELHRYIPVLAAWAGFVVGEVPVAHHERLHGKSKFGRARFYRGFLDLVTVKFLTTYTRRPFHLFGGLGVLIGILGGAILAWMGVEKVLGQRHRRTTGPHHRGAPGGGGRPAHVAGARRGAVDPAQPVRLAGRLRPGAVRQRPRGGPARRAARPPSAVGLEPPGARVGPWARTGPRPGDRRTDRHLSIGQRASLAATSISRNRSAPWSVGGPRARGANRAARSAPIWSRAGGSRWSRRCRKERTVATSVGLTALEVPARGGRRQLDRHGRLEGEQRAGRARPGDTIADDQRSGGQVAEPLVARRHQQRHHADGVRARQQVDEAHDVAHGAGHEADRPRVGRHHAQAGGPLAGGATAGQDLEQHVVPEEDQEGGDREGGAADRAQHAEGQAQREDDHRLYAQVDHDGDEPRAEAGHHDIDVDALRRGDAQPVLVLHDRQATGGPPVNLPGFVAERRARWDELRALVERAGGRVDRLPPTDVLRLGHLYRSAAADLALARRRFAGEAPVAALEVLVGRARGLVYANVSRRDSVRHYVTTGYWQRVRERPVHLAVAVLLLFGPMVGFGFWSNSHPVEATRIAQVSPLSSGGGDGPTGADRGFSTAESTNLSAQIFTNNARVAFVAFAGGLTGGLLTGASLLFNGLIVGLVGGLSIGSGNGDVVLRLLLPHGLLELSLIAVAGAAGLRVGWALVRPGRRLRSAALAVEARAAAEMALGTAVLLVPCGLVEGFVTPRGLSMASAWAVGLALAGTFWALVWWRGRPDGEAVRAGLEP